MDVQNHNDGAPAWVTLEAPDAQKAAEFYAALFGWNPLTGAPDSDGFRVYSLRGKPVAAFRTAEGRPAWRTYIKVTDIERTSREVAMAGGSVTTAPSRMDGRSLTAVFADPAGVAVGAWQADEHSDSVAAKEPNTYVWGELITDDVEASASFYRKVFGWDLAAVSPDDPSGRRDWILRERAIGALFPRPATMPAEVPPYWDVYFEVVDPAATADKAAGLGATVLLPPTDTVHGRIAVFADPVGAVFSVIAPKSH
jgi:predicted enzyme related to lactoylglutathione lyase